MLSFAIFFFWPLEPSILSCMLTYTGRSPYPSLISCPGHSSVMWDQSPLPFRLSTSLMARDFDFTTFQKKMVACSVVNLLWNVPEVLGGWKYQWWSLESCVCSKSCA